MVAAGNMCKSTQFKTLYGATFDLTPLSMHSSSYEITDGDIPCTEEQEKDYHYAFNICGPIESLHDPTAWDYCIENMKTNRGIMDGKAVAVQYDLVGQADDCEVVGFYREDSSDYVWELIDQMDPSRGIKLIYEGPRCNHNGSPQRTFEISVPCVDTVATLPLYANEPDYCQYKVEIPSYHGCPLECPIHKGRLCGGEGVCRYDSSAGQPRCFCNDGREGSACTDKKGSSSQTSGTEVALLVTMLLITLGLVGALFYVVKQVQGYRLEANQFYSMLNVDQDEL